MDNLVLLCSDARQEHMYLLNEFLVANNMRTSLIDKSDSVFPSVGESEIYVHADDYQQALGLMEEFNPGSTQ